MYLTKYQACIHRQNKTICPINDTIFTKRRVTFSHAAYCWRLIFCSLFMLPNEGYGFLKKIVIILWLHSFFCLSRQSFNKSIYDVYICIQLVPPSLGNPWHGQIEDVCTHNDKNLLPLWCMEAQTPKDLAYFT